MKNSSLHISGLVQGVFFRAQAKEKALELGLTGFAENLPDGSVHIEAQGPEEALNSFIAWCRTGPIMARVEKIEITEGQLKSFSGFEVR